MAIPELGVINNDTSMYMFAFNGGIVYTGTLVYIQGQALPNFVFDPRATTASFVSLNNFTSYYNMFVRNLNTTPVSIGLVSGALDVTVSPGSIVPITTEANDDYPLSSNIAVLAGVSYGFTFNNILVPFNAYVSNGSGGIVIDNNGNPVIQQLYGKFYFFTATWYQSGNCSTTLSDQSLIISIVSSWLRAGTMPTLQYYTNNSDCVTSFAYNYCDYRKTCTSTCNGPCVDPNTNCVLNTSNKQYYCSGSSGNSCDNTSFYVVMVLLLVVVLFLIIALIFK